MKGAIVYMGDMVLFSQIQKGPNKGQALLIIIMKTAAE